MTRTVCCLWWSGLAGPFLGAFDAFLAFLKDLYEAETLMVQYGNGGISAPPGPPGVIANSNLYPHWQTQEHFDEWPPKA